MIRTLWSAGCLAAFLALPSFAAGEPGPAHLVADFLPGSSEFRLEDSDFARVGERAVFLGIKSEESPSLWGTDGTRVWGLGVLCPPCGEAELLGSTGRIAFYRVRLWEGGDLMPTWIWRTDGTPAGTFPVTGRLSTRMQEPAAYALTGDRLYFTACTPEAGCEPWSSDGSVAGTALAGEVVAGPESGNLRELAAAGGRAFLIVGEADGGTALWVADGPGGLKRLRAVPEAGGLAAGGAGSDRVFFLAADAAGREVWTSAGTAGGTRPVTRFAPRDPFGPDPGLQIMAGRLFFRADDGAHGVELWSLSAAGAGGLRRVTDFRGRGLTAGEVQAVGERFVFPVVRRSSDGHEAPRTSLWTSRGDFRSTAPLAGCPEGCPLPSGRLAPARGGLVFLGSVDARNEDLWVTDGTGPGTRPLHRLGGTYLAHSVAADGRVLFGLAADEEESSDLWLTDGTAAGTFRAGRGETRWSHYYGWGGPFDLVAAGGRLVFLALDGEEASWDSFWSSDGTPAGTRLLAADRQATSSWPNTMVPVGDGLLVQSCGPGEEGELWLVQGGETTRLPSGGATGCGGIVSAVSFEGFAVVLAYGGEGLALLRMDGTPGGTAVLLPAAPVSPEFLTRFGERAAFVTQPSSGPARLWVTDGSPQGTRPWADLPAGLAVSGLAGSGGRLFFLASRDEGPVEIWSSDGTPTGTRRAVTAASGMRLPQALAVLGDRLYFAARRAGDLPRRFLPWVSDGTDAGTEPLAEASMEWEIFAGVDSWGREDRPRFAELAGRVFFAATDPAHGDELWSTDGTPAGTARLLDIAPGALGSYPRGLAVWRDRLWFRARDAAHGMELWTSDGTAAGSHLVQDIAADGSWSVPWELTPSAAGLYFSANDGVHGRELWVVEPE